mmetsp:Transcript_36241/g.90467  ORF Transcript_36241/g.90467 Transcript_36241/m.90467 type:complete len:202 (+) Transcript_36241:360-965(+)
MGWSWDFGLSTCSFLAGGGPASSSGIFSLPLGAQSSPMLSSSSGASASASSSASSPSPIPSPAASGSTTPTPSPSASPASPPCSPSISSRVLFWPLLLAPSSLPPTPLTLVSSSVGGGGGGAGASADADADADAEGPSCCCGCCGSCGSCGCGGGGGGGWLKMRFSASRNCCSWLTLNSWSKYSRVTCAESIQSWLPLDWP